MRTTPYDHTHLDADRHGRARQDGRQPRRRLMRDGHMCIVYYIDAVASLKSDGATAASSSGRPHRPASQPRAVWVMVPAGTSPPPPQTRSPINWTSWSPTTATPTTVTTSVGISGGVPGIKRGYYLMIGGGTAESITSTRSSLPSPRPCPRQPAPRGGPGHGDGQNG